MTTSRRWYTEPETFIALAALIVSISAVAVGLYEAALQRHHDRAEVWPHPEIEVFTKLTGAEIVLENTGIGPAIVHAVVVTVDVRPQHNWREVLRRLNGTEPLPFSNYSTVQHGLRPGDRLPMLDVPVADVPRDFWKSIARVGVSICYSSVFDQYWVVESKGLGGPIVRRDTQACAAQADSVDF